MIAVLINVLLPITLVALSGFVLQRQLRLDLATLNRVVIYGLSPALIFVSLVETDVGGSDAFRMIGLAVGVVAGMALITTVCVWPFGIRGGDLSAMLLVSLFMNSGNYGLPAARFAFGEQGFDRALLYFIAQAIMAQTLGVAVAAAGGVDAQGGALLLQAAKRVLRMPQIYAVTLALLVRFSGWVPGQADDLANGLFNGVSLLSEAALPLMLVILGMQLGIGVSFEQPRLVALATGLRLVVSPLLAYGLALVLGLDTVGLSVGVMLAGMPAAVNTTILAIEFNNRPTLVVGTVVATSIGSLITLTLLLAFLPGRAM